MEKGASASIGATSNNPSHSRALSLAACQASQKLVVIGISATPQDKLRLIGGFEIDRIEIRHGDNDVVVLDHHNEAL
jgi:hypothetical protein